MSRAGIVQWMNSTLFIATGSAYVAFARHMEAQMKRTALPLLLATLCIAAGCASPEARIRKNPEMFEALPEEVRAQVERGQVEPGFAEDAVFLALGKPDREYTRRTEAGVSKVWSYVEREYYSDRQRVRGTFNVRDERGRLRSVRDDVWVDVQNWREFEATRVEMKNGVVVAIENLRP